MAAMSKVFKAQQCRDSDLPKATHSINHTGGLRGRGEEREKLFAGEDKGRKELIFLPKPGNTGDAN